MTCEKIDSQNESDNFSKLPINIMRAGVSMTARIVFAELASYGLNIFPSYNKIADNLRISRRTAIRAVKELSDKGLIKKYTRIKDNGGNTSNSYILPSDKIVTPPSDKIVTPPSDKIVTPPSDKIVTPNKINKNNNNLFKINNITRAGRAKIAAAAAQSAAELERNDKDMQLLSLFLQAKGSTWFEFVRIKQTYYLRPRTKMALNVVTNAEYNNLIDLIKEQAGSCQPLKVGQHNEREVIINV